jgi:hypothetical protein
LRTGLALIVLILNVFAILSILGARRGAGERIAWLAAVVLLPVVGAFAWFASRRKQSRRTQENGGHYDGYNGPRRR